MAPDDKKRQLQEVAFSVTHRLINCVLAELALDGDERSRLINLAELALSPVTETSAYNFEAAAPALPGYYHLTLGPAAARDVLVHPDLTRMLNGAS